MPQRKRIYIPVSEDTLKIIQKIARQRDRSVAFISAEALENSFKVDSYKITINGKKQ